MKTTAPEQRTNSMVSIIMPCYNAQAFVGQAIDSVIEQTWSEWELLVIDDGSCDESPRIVQEWAEKDARIIPLVNEHNMGVSKTRNRGISLAKGDWIAFLDSDDVWERDKLEEQMLLVRKQSASFVFTSCSIIDQHSQHLGVMVSPPPTVTYSQLKKWNCITCSSALVSKKALGVLRFAHDDSREDYLLWLRVIKNLDVAHSIGKPLVRYRVISGSRSANKMKMLRDTYRVHRHMGVGVTNSVLNTLSHFYHAFQNKYRRIRTN